MRILSLIIAVMIFTCGIHAAESSHYEALAKKERMFYNAREWPGASAMLTLMIAERPSQPDLYGRAIVVQSLMNDTTGAVDLLSAAMKNKVPFDSVFCNVKKESFELGRSELYEKFLVQVKESHPWLIRTVDGYLLDYYCFRRDGTKMVEFSKIMLEGLPDNTVFLSILAQGYLLEGATEKGILTYRQLLHYNPTDYQATLYLANYYYDRWETTRSDYDFNQAQQFLTRANELKPTPFIRQRLNSLENARKK